MKCVHTHCTSNTYGYCKAIYENEMCLPFRKLLNYKNTRCYLEEVK